MSDPIHPEGIWACSIGHTWPEYINGCPACEIAGVRSSVKLVVPEPALLPEAAE